MFAVLAIFLVRVAAGAASGYAMLPGMDVTATVPLNPFHYAVLNDTEIYDAQIPGSSLQNVPSYVACAIACAATPTCVGFSHNRLYWSCTMHATVSNFDPSDDRMAGNDDSGLNPAYIPYTAPAEVLMAICEGTPGCATFSTGDGLLRSFAANGAYNSWLSNATCGYAGKAAIVPGTCMSPTKTWMTCAGIAAVGAYSVANNMTLAPYQLEEQCDMDPACVGFVAAADNSHGWLLNWAAGTAPATVGVLMPPAM